MAMDIWERVKSGEEILISDPACQIIRDAFENAKKITSEYNGKYNDHIERIKILSELTHSEIDVSSDIMPPFHCDIGFHIKIGKNVFVNHGCSFLDQGGITLEDNVMLGPHVRLVTSNHPLDYMKRRAMSTNSNPIIVKKDAWIGCNAIILPGITIGERSVVGAGAIVTKDVPPDTVVVGNPARPIKNLKE